MIGDLRDRVHVVLPIVEEATVKMGKMFRMPEANLRTEFKAADGATPRTVIDTVIGDLIVQKISSAYPDESVSGEDAIRRIDRASPHEWESDSVDGTRNILFKIQQSVVGVNFNIRGSTALSFVGNPFERTITFAVRDGGAFVFDLNTRSTRRIYVDTGKKWHQKLLLLDSNFAEKAAPRKLEALAVLCKHAMNLGSFGSNLYHWSLVAEGRAHYVLTDTVGGYWDIAGHLLVSEAKGRGTDLAGREPLHGCEVTIGSTGENHDEICRALAEIYDGYTGFR